MHEFENGMALDIGANIGNHSIFFSRHFKFLHAFEPNPRTVELLKFNTNNIENIKIHPFGLGDTESLYELKQDPANLGISSIKFNIKEGVITTIPVKTLDDLNLQSGLKLQFIKIDVEGFEEQVITGGINLIARETPIIVFEQHQSEFNDGSTPSINALKKLGYIFSWEQKQKQSRFWILRRLNEVWKVVFGVNCQFLTAKEVPPGNHTMLIAIPPRLHKILGA